MGGVDKGKYHAQYTKSVIESPFVSDIFSLRQRYWESGSEPIYLANFLMYTL